MYTYGLGQTLLLLEGAPVPGTAAVYVLTSEELARHPQCPGWRACSTILPVPGTPGCARRRCAGTA